MLKKNLCKICNEQHDFLKYKIKRFNLKFITGDYKKINAVKDYRYCPNTQFIFTKINKTWLKCINKIYKNYYFSSSGIFKSKLTREKIIKNQIQKKIPKTLKILEIGPGSGSLIKELNNLKYLKNIDALELNSKNIASFKKNKKFNSLYNDINMIKKKYDLIILSHSLFHIIDLYKFFSTLKNKVDKGGKLLIVTPNPLKYLILPYVFEIFSFSNKKNIIAYLSKFDFYLKYDLKNILKKEIFLIFEKKEIIIKQNSDKSFIKKFFNVQNILTKKINALKKFNSIIIKGKGLKGSFLLLNLKNNIYRIFDDNLKGDIIINKSLIKVKKKKIVKSYEFI